MIEPMALLMGMKTGRLIAGQRVKRKPVAYLYNGKVRPTIPEHDESTYPYMLVCDWFGMSHAYAFSAPITYTDSSGIGSECIVATPFLHCELLWNRQKHNNWSEWKTVSESEGLNIGSDEWVNHDVVASDGTVLYSTGDKPIPVYLPLVLFDGETVTEQPSYSHCAGSTIMTSFDLAVGDILRITTNGISEEYTVGASETNTFPEVGNRWLNDRDEPDDGGDWYLCDSSTNTAFPRAYFHTRTAGTYQLKIELIRKAE